VAVVPEVRRVLIERMRRIIAEHDRRIVVEGRDITTVVAPDAEVRVLLTADAQARIGRRAGELGGRVSRATVTDSILRRDRDDSTVSNFTEAACGVSVIDSTNLDLDEVVAEILTLVPDA
jgi:cytidylate kinase